MLVFLDTELTDLLGLKLLSIGLATMNPGQFLYAELDLNTAAGKARAKASTDFVRNGGVLEQWGLVPGAPGTEWEMGWRAGDWLLGLAAETGAKVEVAFNYSVDFELLECAIWDAGPWDQVLDVAIPINVNSITGTITGELAAENFYEDLAKLGKLGIRRHHALADAQALRETYIAVKAVGIASSAVTRRKAV
ncbi:MAG: hypothetical protein Q7T07_00135 [Burkholderiaceae bacterium]|nr:hypothetical protein [Burkholderiaceae bacterium]